MNQTPRFSFAAKLADTFVTSKITVIFMVATLIFGIYALVNTPREDNPQINVPGASIQVQLPGASAAEVEQLVVRPLEGAIRRLPHVDKFYSTALNSVALVSVQFDVGEDQDKSLVKLKDRVEAARQLLPKGAGVPLIRSMNVDDVPIVTVTLASAKYSDYALKRIADRMMDGLRTMPDVSNVFVKGGRDRELLIELNPDRMQGFGITLDHVRQLLAAANISAPLGNVVYHQRIHQVFLDGDLRTPEQLKKLVMGIHKGQPVYLADIASITDGPPDERKTVSRFGFGPADPRFGQSQQPDQPAVTLAVAKQKGTNSVVVAREILKRVQSMKAKFVPADVEVVTTRDEGKIANETVNELIDHLGVAVIAVFLVTLFFLGRKEAMIVGLSVPLVLGLTLGMDYLFGQTINRVSLFGVIMSLGLLVDDAIVVIENIHRHYQQGGGGSKREITIAAAREIGNPTNLATVAVMLVFSSLVTVTGMVGEYFQPMAFTVPVAMASSLLIAYTVVPWAAYRWLKMGASAGSNHATPNNSTSNNATAETGSPHQHNAIQRRYLTWMKPLVHNKRRRRWVFVSVLGLIAFSVLQPSWQFIRPSGVSGPQSWFGVATTMMPSYDEDTFNITLDMPEYSPIEETDKAARMIARVVRDNPQVSNYQIWLGQSGVMDFFAMLRGSANKKGPYVAEIRVNLRPHQDRHTTSLAVIRELRPRVQAVAAKFPGAVVQVLQAPPGPPVRSTLLAEIYGPDESVLRKITRRVADAFHHTWDLVEVKTSEPADVSQYRLTVDREKAALSGLTTADVVKAMRRLIDGEYLGRAHIAGEENPVPVELLIPRRYQLDIAHLSRAYVTNRQGVKVPLSEMVHVEKAEVDRPIFHKNGARVEFVYGEMGGTSPLYAVTDLNRRLQGVSIPGAGKLATGNLGVQREVINMAKGYTLLWGGAQRQTLDSYRDLGGAMGVSLLFIYLMLVAYFQSFSLPVVAMVAVPLGIVGVFPGHWLMHAPFSAASMVGVIALAGVVIRNSLLIIDFVLEFRRQGVSIEEAVVAAGAVRLRPILLTTLAIMLGSAILLKDPLFGGMAISLIFGTFAATVLTLLVVPLVLYLLLGWRERRQQRS